jgi:8-oxo-dGTP pyrophosphatase MutT (NUDIX family)
MVRIQRMLVSLIVRSRAGVLLLQRARPYSEFLRHDPDTQVGMDLWELPGGSLDFGETPLQATVRETSEETGISVKEGNLNLVACCAYTLKGSGCASHRVHIIYEVNVGAASHVKHSKEHAAHQWVRDKGPLQVLSMIAEVRNLVAARL